MVDAHTHVWTLDPAAYPWQPTLSHVPIPTEAATKAQLVGEMDAADVEWVVLVQPSVYDWDNSYLCDAIAAHPCRPAGVCLVDPDDAAAPAQLAHGCVAGCRGFRFNLTNQDDVSWLLEPRLEPLWLRRESSSERRDERAVS
jgi:predicted TIM-barrel fold metal-dependent hydrolase